MDKKSAIFEFSGAAIDAVPVGVTILDELINVLECNDNVLDWLEAPKEYYIEKFLELSPEYQPDGEKSSEKAASVVKRALEGEIFTFEWTHLTTAGEEVPFEVTATRALYKGKYVAVTYQYDLRYIKNMADELENKSRLLRIRLEQQELISEITRSFVSSSETKALIREAVAKFGHYHKVSLAVIFKLDIPNNNIYPAYIWSSDNKMISSIQEVGLNETLKSSFPERLYAFTAIPVLSCVDTSTSKFDGLRNILDDNAKAFIFAPLYVEGLLWGMISVQQLHEPRYWTDNEKSFVATISSTIAGAIMLDIYNHKLKEAFDKVTAASRAKSDFLSNMSHEMRTPMNAIINMTKIAKKADDLERKNYALDKIADASAHLLGVINDILDMSKIEANKFELSPVEFNFEKMLNRVVNVVNFRIEEKKQKLTIQIDKDIPKVLICDDQRLTQVITNLVGNAVKFTPENGLIKIGIYLLSEENGICKIQVSVIDTGIGISSEQQKRLFQSFQQAETTTTRKYGGTGLGLSISKNIVEMMGGKIWIESEMGKGSTFAFTIQAKRGAEEISDEKIEPVETKKAGAGSNDFTGHRILLAEDVDINREIVTTLLEPTHVEIDIAENGTEAVKMYTEHPDRYELILMDVQMPGMDGYEATIKIRAFEKKLEESGAGKHVPVIAMTANVFKEDIKNCINAGMDDHIGKPLDFENVLEKLRNYLIIKPVLK
ncbi:MAG: ATP-binding protein [Treponema sp.]|nr:ATP-binding protein [Treponema sp.]